MTDRTGEWEPAGSSEPTEEEPIAGAAEADAESEPEAAEGAAANGAEAGGDAGELQALRERYLRLAAEYDNYRKRTEKERGESWTRAQGQLVQQLLDGLDDLQRVADFTAETASVQAVIEGVQMVERKVLRALEGAGLEVLEAAGKPFDPTVHEALVAAPAEKPEEDQTIGEVFQKGYRFKGDLLRPARVQVRKYGG